MGFLELRRQCGVSWSRIPVVVSVKASHLLPTAPSHRFAACLTQGETVIRRITKDPKDRCFFLFCFVLFLDPLLTNLDWEKSLERLRESHTLRCIYKITKR